MKNTLLSIIVPMYKVEQYITKCLNSIINQMPQSGVELIIVNDGSPDRSGDIAKEIAGADTRITILNQTNKGLSAARNLGSSAAKGEYVWFIDSDDWIGDNSLIEIMKMINDFHPDAIHICGADIIDNIPVKLFSLSKYTNQSKRGIDMIKENMFHGVVQYTIYKKEILDKFQLIFYEGIYHEDTEFSPRAYYYLNNVRCIDKALYMKRINDESITRTVNIKKNRDLVLVSRSLRNFALNKCDDQSRPLYMRLASNALKMAMRNEIQQMTSENKKDLNKILFNNNDLFKSFINSDYWFYKFTGLCHFLSPKHHLEMMSIIDSVAHKLN